jgi:hypothetical protein
LECDIFGISEEDPETGYMLPPVSDWCGPSTKSKGTKDISTYNHTTRKRLKENNEFTLEDRNIYDHRKDYRFGTVTNEIRKNLDHTNAKANSEGSNFTCSKETFGYDNSGKDEDLRVPAGKPYKRWVYGAWTGRAKDIRPIHKLDYLEDDVESADSGYSGLKYFHKPIYFYIPELKKYDIEMKNKLIEHKNFQKGLLKSTPNLLTHPNKTKNLKEFQNILAYGYSYFPPMYNKYSSLSGGDDDNSVPNFPTVQFCYPYIKQTSNYKVTSNSGGSVISSMKQAGNTYDGASAGTDDEKISGNAHDETKNIKIQKCFDKNATAADIGPITKALTYDLSVNIFRKSNINGKTLLINVKDKMNTTIKPE